MNWKSIVREEIMGYEANLESIENLEKRIRACEEDKVAMKSSRSDGTPVQGGTSRIEDRWINLIVEEDLAKEQLANTQRRVALVERGLAKLDERERDILIAMSCRMYGDDTIDKLCEKHAIEKATLYRIWRQASKKYKNVQFGAE